MDSYSNLFAHLESGKCPKMHNPTLFMLCLGKWWYSPLYMDLDLHAQIRTNRINLSELELWMNEGLLQPFLCRNEGCRKGFSHMSALTEHCEANECSWDVARLNVVGLKNEVERMFFKKD